jgi:hypothetical protein
MRRQAISHMCEIVTRRMRRVTAGACAGGRTAHVQSGVMPHAA